MDKYNTIWLGERTLRFLFNEKNVKIYIILKIF